MKSSIRQPLVLQEIVEDIQMENLPPNWQKINVENSQFSTNKIFFKFQRQALAKALKSLWLYFKAKEANKRQLYSLYQNNGLQEIFNYGLKKEEDKRAAQHLLTYDEDYPVKDAYISYAHFINRMSFWMATGSGKTLIIVKLIEMLGKLIAAQELPSRDILFLAHRDDLLEQFKEHVTEFNQSNPAMQLHLIGLKDYPDVKREHPLPLTHAGINVFCYRSDLISDSRKKAIVDFADYDNNGNWYILLDEAHKGDKGEKVESKRQILYSILSRNGFLFNFSATFTDARDHATCAYNFNLAKFVEAGYSKHIYVSSTGVGAFKGKDDFDDEAKQRIVLKTLLLLTYIHKHFEKIRKVNDTLYHRPLLLTLVNSVQAPGSDLDLFFRELEKIAQNEIAANLLEKAKDELVHEFRDDPAYEFETGITCSLDSNQIAKLGYTDILRYVLNAKKPGRIEVLKLPGNKKELIFKLVTSDRPFALIKIGDTSAWLKQQLAEYEINESYDHASYFKKINKDDSDISILMGSRSFYEGWDSNRPNILLFINIGVGKRAKKFVLQAIGRGVRIEPIKNQRRRLLELVNAQKIEEELYERIKKSVPPLESLLVFGTNAQNIKEVVGVLKEERPSRPLGDAFIVNPAADGQLFLIPDYKDSDKILADENQPQKYPITDEGLDETWEFYEDLDDKIALVLYDCDVSVLKKAKESFTEEKRGQYYANEGNASSSDPEINLGRIFNHFAIRNQVFDKFEKLTNQIVHFREIRLQDDEDKYQELLAKNKIMQRKPAIQQKLAKEYGQMEERAYKELMGSLMKADSFDMNKQKISIKHLADHYYLPVIVPADKDEKVDFISNIINVPSEVAFINELEQQAQNISAQVDWWMFSKLDHTLDRVTIPYYNPALNTIAAFHPDFIFWMRKGPRYLILFVDPKGTEHTAASRKIDGYTRIFETDKEQSKDFRHNHDGNVLTINVGLLLKTTDTRMAPDRYSRHWFDNFAQFADKIREFIAPVNNAP